MLFRSYYSLINKQGAKAPVEAIAESYVNGFHTAGMNGHQVDIELLEDDCEACKL